MAEKDDIFDLNYNLMKMHFYWYSKWTRKDNENSKLILLLIFIKLKLYLINFKLNIFEKTNEFIPILLR